jgi:hypothetical protein
MFGYNRAPGTPIVSLFVTCFALLVVGLPFYFFIWRQGAVGLSIVPYAIPVAAIAVAVLVGVGHRMAGTPSFAYGGNSARRGNPVAAAVGSLVLVGACVFMSFKAGADVQRYNTDKSCAAGFALDSSAQGACSLDHVRITRTYYGGRSGNTQYITVQLHDGSLQTVRVGTNLRGDVFDGARHGDVSATIQYFDGRIAQVETQSGRSATTSMPFEAEKQWTIIGLVGGGFGLIAAVIVLTRGIL